MQTGGPVLIQRAGMFCVAHTVFFKKLNELPTFKNQESLHIFLKSIISISENSERSVYTGPTFLHDNNRQNLRSGWSLLM